MVTVAALAILAGQDQPNIEVLDKLVRNRGEMERRYQTNPKLDVIRIGTSNLGNPYDEWFWPSGSAAYQLYISSYGQRGSFAMVGKKGKISTVLWAVDLVPSPDKEPMPTGTIARVIWVQGMRPSGRLSTRQRDILSRKGGYAAFAWGRGPNTGDIRTWYVYSTGRLSANYFDCYAAATPSGGGVNLSAEPILLNPPITPDECKAIGFPRKMCYNVLPKNTIEVCPLSWHARPELPDAIPNRAKLLEAMPRQ